MHYALLQNALTFAIDAILVGSTTYLGVGLGLHLKQKWDKIGVKKPAMLPEATAPLLEATAIPVEAVTIAEQVRQKDVIPVEPLDSLD